MATLLELIPAILASFGEEAGSAGQIILSGVEAGLSANRIAAALVRAGLGRRRGTLLGIISQVQAEFASGPYLNSLGLQDTFNPNRLASGSPNQLGAYNITALLDVRDPLTGAIEQFNRTVSLSRIVAMQNVEAAFHTFEFRVTGETPALPGEITEVTYQRSTRRP